jgi:hypothetical protein
MERWLLSTNQQLARVLDAARLQTGPAVTNSFAEKVSPPFGWQGKKTPDLVALGQLTLFLQSFQLFFSGHAFFHAASSREYSGRRCLSGVRWLVYF